MPSLRDQRIVITGASSGVGLATAVEMARRGGQLVLAARRPEALERAAQACRALGARCEIVPTDVDDPAQCRLLIARAIELLGGVDVLVNNAGFAIFDPIIEARAEDLEAMMRTNYFGMVHCTQAALPGMLARGSGAIVNVGSIAGLMGYARMGGYCATKFAITGFTEALRDEVHDSGVHVSLLCPGTIDTEFFTKAERSQMPGASRLILAISPERVANAIADAAETGTYRRILPFFAYLYMRLKELAPRTAHFFMRRVSALMEKR